MPLHQTLQAFAGKRPTLGEQTFVAPNASVIGDVTIGNRASVWYGAVLRGEADCLIRSTASAVCRVSWAAAHDLLSRALLCCLQIQLVLVG